MLKKRQVLLKGCPRGEELSSGEISTPPRVVTIVSPEQAAERIERKIAGIGIGKQSEQSVMLAGLLFGGGYRADIVMFGQRRRGRECECGGCQQSVTQDRHSMSRSNMRRLRRS